MPQPDGPKSASGEVALAYIVALNTHDPEQIAALVADDFVNEHTSALGSSLIGRDAYKARLPSFLASFEGLRYEVEDVIVDDARVALPYTLTARCRGSDGESRPILIRGMFRFRIEHGLIAHRVDYWDSKVYETQVEGR